MDDPITYDYGRPRPATCDYCHLVRLTYECGRVVIREEPDGASLTRERRICTACLHKIIENQPPAS